MAAGKDEKASLSRQNPDMVSLPFLGYWNSNNSSIPSKRWQPNRSLGFGGNWFLELAWWRPKLGAPGIIFIPELKPRAIDSAILTGFLGN